MVRKVLCNITLPETQMGGTEDRGVLDKTTTAGVLYPKLEDTRYADWGKGTKGSIGQLTLKK